MTLPREKIVELLGKQAAKRKLKNSPRQRKIRAWQEVHRAVKFGRLVKPDKCENCGLEPKYKTFLQGHHKDYDKPLEVEWLCISCHRALHLARQYREVWKVDSQGRITRVNVRIM